MTAREVEVRGVKIPKGAAISACTASANRDEDVFENSEIFDIHRPAKPNFGFGFGPHMCVGMFVAKAEILSAANRILDLLPNLRLDPDHAAPQVTGVHSRGVKALHVLWD